jgi:hypothetical protein
MFLFIKIRKKSNLNLRDEPGMWTETIYNQGEKVEFISINYQVDIARIDHKVPGLI